ncbi:MAG: GEVED domain-containing protein, partial [Flavobacteriales bacterium]
YAAQPITGFVNGPSGDDVISAPLALPFTFNFFNEAKSNFFINTNGQIGFNYVGSTAAQQRTAQVVPNATLPNDNISLCWADLNPTAGQITYGTIGTTPNRIFVVSYLNVPFFGGTGIVSGQIHLYETTNVVEVHVTSVTLNTANKTIGLENAAGNDGAAAPGRNGVNWLVGAPEAWRFTPNEPAYSWSPNTFLDFDNIANPEASGVTVSTAYTVTATSPAGCTSQESITVSIGATLSSVTIAPVAPEYCAGSSVLLTATPVDGGAPYTYQWFDPSNNPMGTDDTQTADQPGLWTVILNDACGAPPVQASVTVIEKPTPSASATASQACLGGTLDLDGTTDFGTSVAWTGPNSFNSIVEDPSISPVVAANAGTYSFTATFDGCTSAPATVIVAVDDSPIITSTTASPNPVCTGNDSQLNVNVQTNSYCTASITGGACTGDEYLSNVTFAGINNNSGCTYGAPNQGYNDFTAISGNVVAGSTYTLDFTIDQHFSSDQAALFVDWNQDGDFLDLNETYAFPTTVAGVNTQSIAVPAGALNGNTRMRMRLNFAAAAPACGGTTFGEIEDYSLNVTGGGPAPGTVSFAWSPNTFLSADDIADPVAVQPTATTAYSVLVTGGNGCTATGNVTLTVNQTPDVDLAAVPDCANDQFSISVLVNSTGSGPTVDLSYTVNGGSPIGVPGLGTGPQTPLGPFNAADDVVVTVIDPVGGCNLPGEVFRSGCPEIVNCPSVLTKTHCYDNGDTKTWYFKAVNPGETITLSFISGTMDPNDVIRGYTGSDNSGIPIVELTGSFADLGSPQVNGTSLGDELFLEIDSDGSNSCQDSQQASWLFEVECTPGCVNPSGTVTPIPNCVAQNFSIDVTVDFVGDGALVDIEYIVDGGTPVVIPGVLEGATEIIGPFDFGQGVQVFLNHETDNACNLNLGFTTLTQSACPNEIPCSAWILGMNPNYTCVTTTAGDMTGSTLAPGITGGCTGVVQDQWYRFTATATTHRVQLAGTTTGLSHSIFTGNPDCTNLQLVAGTSCVAGATASNPAGLTIGQIYYVRVSRTTVGTNAYTVCVSAPPLIDADATVLALPLATACYGANETVSVTVLNNAIYPLDMSVNPLTVNVNVTGAVVTSLSGTINTGVVAPGATINVPMSATLDMSAAGAYTFNGACVVVGDGNAANDPMTAATRTTVAPFALPITQNFTGFTGSNLATLVAPNNGWREGNGAALPAGTTSTWTSSVAAQQTALGSGVSARIQMTTTARNEWIVSPKFIPVLGTQMSYRIALTEFGTGGADAGTPSPGMQPGDQVIVKVSTDCGASFNPIFTHNATTPIGLTNVFQDQLIDLSGFAGQEVIIAFHATKPASTPHPNYDFHLDDINIQNVAVCTGMPTAGTANSSNAGPACAPASTTLSVSGQSTDGGIVVTWWGSNSPGGPYTINQGSGTVLGVSGLTATRYWRGSVKCTLSGDSALTAEVSTVVTPTPSANASAGPACTDQTLNLFGATDFGTSFTWTGPNSFNSTAQNPNITSITSAAGGTYTFTATANGCSTSSQVVVAVNTTPVITSLTATPNPVCIGDDSQLEAIAPVSGYFMGSGGASFIDISGTGTPVTPAAGDDTEHNVTIPGGFIFSGTSYTDIRIGSNGVVVFGSTTGDVALTNAALPSTANSAGNVFLAPFWDDFDDGPATPAGNIYTEQVGDVFIIQWQTYPHFSAVSGQNITFQVQLNLLTNVVYFVYQDVIFGGTQSTLDAGLSATVGIQWAASAGNFIQYSFNTASLVDGQVISFTPNQANFQWTPSTYLTADNIADPIAQNVLANETYSVVATAANGCASAPLQITLEANPAMAAGQAEILPVNASFCTGSNVTLTANPLGGGGPYTFAWTDPNSNPAGTDATQLVNQTGTWSVVINDNCGGTASASIVVSEFPVPVATAGSTEPACSGAPVNFTATSTVVGSTFAWSGPGGFNSTDQNPVIASATLANSGTYSVVASANGCSSVPATTVVNVNTTPSVPVVNPAVWSLCPGGSVDLAASSGAAGTGTIGNGAIQNTGTTFPTPYGAFWESVRTQYLLLPADLSAMGAIPGGTLSSIGFFVADVGTSGQHTAYTIRMGNSAATSLSIAAFETVPATPVFGPVNYQPVAGLNTHVLSTPFVWTGGSVIVDICHSNDPDGTGGVQYTNNAVINSTATAFTSAIWKNNDNIENCLTVDAPLGSSLNRANMTFGYSFTPTLTWSPAAGLNTTTGPLVTATPASTTTYTVSAENAGCIASADAIVHIGNNELALEVSTDANGDELSYEFREEGTNTLFYAVGQNSLPSNALATTLNCLPDGCYYLVVNDAGGDGIVGGGYLLRENDGSQRRIIDNNRDLFGAGGFTNGAVSQIAGNEGFCLPVGTDRLIVTSCDKRDWKLSPCGGEFVVANANAAVTAQYGVNNANSGYQMWWYQPNGGYSFKRFQSHSTTNGLAASATRACHFMLNGWSGNQLVEGTFYNVKVRGRVNGVYNTWGPACRLVVNSTEAQCPRTKL